MRIKIHGRLSFPDLFAPRPFKPGDKPKFKATFLVPKDGPEHKKISEAIIAVAKAKWPGGGPKEKDYRKILAAIKGNANKFCFQDGETKSYAGYEGMMAFSANSPTRPLVVDCHHTKDSPAYLSESDGRPYAGCHVIGSVEIFAYDNSGDGISATLRGVQFVKDGEAFSGGGAASDDEFDDLSVEDEEEALV
jgi:hypothetical protein